MSKKSKTKTSNTSHTVVTPTTPDWLSSAVQSLTGRIQGLGAVNPQDYVAPVSALERQAAEGAAGLGRRQGGDEMTAGSDAWFSRMMNGPAPSVSAAN